MSEVEDNQWLTKRCHLNRPLYFYLYVGNPMVTRLRRLLTPSLSVLLEYRDLIEPLIILDASYG